MAIYPNYITIIVIVSNQRANQWRGNLGGNCLTGWNLCFLVSLLCQQTEKICEWEVAPYFGLKKSEMLLPCSTVFFFFFSLCFLQQLANNTMLNYHQLEWSVYSCASLASCRSCPVNTNTPRDKHNRCIIITCWIAPKQNCRCGQTTRVP